MSRTPSDLSKKMFFDIELRPPSQLKLEEY